MRVLMRDQRTRSDEHFLVVLERAPQTETAVLHVVQLLEAAPIRWSSE